MDQEVWCGRRWKVFQGGCASFQSQTNCSVYFSWMDPIKAHVPISCFFPCVFGKQQNPLYSKHSRARWLLGHFSSAMLKRSSMVTYWEGLEILD